MLQEESDPHHVGPGRWRVPAGSVVIDIGLVIAMVYTGGQMTKAVEHLDKRITVIEQREITPGAASRLSAAEARITSMESQFARLSIQLDRIEDKIDRHSNGDNRGK